MPADPLTLDEAHRRALGGRLKRMRELIGELRVAGLESETLAELERSLETVGAETAALAPAPPRSLVEALLAQLLVLAFEIGPRRLEAYGKLDEEAATRLEERSTEMATLVQRLMEESETRRRADAL